MSDWMNRKEVERKYKGGSEGRVDVLSEVILFDVA